MQTTSTKTPQELISFLIDHPGTTQVKDNLDPGVELISWSLPASSDVQYVTVGHESVVYVVKGRIAVGEVGSEDSAAQTKPFLLGAREPYHKKSDITLMLYACKGDCEVLVFNFPGSEVTNAEIDLDRVHQFKQDASHLDDYYFGYDERYSKVYEAGATLWESDQPNQSLLSVIEKHHTIFTGKIVDLGCGEGRDTLYLASQGYEVTGVDVSKSALDKARERAKQHELQVKFVETDVIFLRTMTDNTFDLAMNMGCLHMLTDQVQRNNHIQRVFEILKPGGHFLVDHCQDHWGKGFFSIPDYDAIADDLVPGKSIPRRIRLEQGETEIDLEVLPFSERNKNELIDEICAHGFEVVDVDTSNTEAFGNSAVLLFKKPSV